MNIVKKLSDRLTNTIYRTLHEAGYTLDADGIDRYLHSPGGMNDEIVTAIHAAKAIQKAKPVVFSTDQLDVFFHMRKTKIDAVDYLLPFEHTLIQLSRLYPVNIPDSGLMYLSAILLLQKTLDQNAYNEYVSKSTYGRVVPMTFGEGNKFVHLNNLFVFTEKDDSYAVGSVNWQSDSIHHELVGGPEGIDIFRDLAVACIGYINCENIYLEKQGEVDEAVNRKREAKGKSRLEPYYVCRIRGVQYDSHATGEGSKHGIRYDVRGHFRRLETGKTIWVRPHQRGLQNELYVPKVYKVEKGSKPEWQA